MRENFGGGNAVIFTLSGNRPVLEMRAIFEHHSSPFELPMCPKSIGGKKV
jgi:hypothetical protein